MTFPLPERKVLRFSILADYLRKIEVERGITIYHLYPSTIDWIGRQAPDEVNPRSHEDGALRGNVPQAIRQTLRDLRRNNSSVSAGLRADFDKPLAQSRKASYLRF